MRGSTEPRVLELRSGAYRARIVPAAGARVASLAWCDAGEPVDLLVPWDGSAFPEHAWPKAGAFPMLPFANRLPAEGFRFDGRLVRPEGAPGGMIQHGVAHRRSWRVTEAAADNLCMRLDEEPRTGWPWAWSAEMEISLGADGMTVAMRVANASREPMPLGMGWHPYHPAGRLVFAATARHELDGAGTACAPAQEPMFGVRPGETAAFSGWSGRAELQVARGRIAVRSEGVPHAVVHQPASGAYLCIEPVTVLPGHVGSAALLPGEIRQLSWTCGFSSASST